MTSYIAASGEVVRGGCWPPAGAGTPAATIVLIGDSNTAIGVDASIFPIAHGLIGAPLRPLANIALSGTTVGHWVTAIDAPESDPAYPGLSGLAKGGWAWLQIGTNNAKSQPINSTIQTEYAALVAKLLATYVDRVIMVAIPPIGGTEAAAAGNVAGYNAAMQAMAAADPDHVYYINPWAPVTDPDGSATEAHFDAMGIHPNNSGTMLAAIACAPMLAAILAPHGYPMPLATSSADVYPAQPQWATNPTMQGTAGSKDANWSGQVATGYALTSTGGVSGAASIVAADVGDAVQVPWQRLALGNIVSGQRISITSIGAGRAISTSDPGRIDQVVQIRFAGINGGHLNRLYWWIQGSTGHRIASDSILSVGDIGTALDQTLTLRQAYRRPTSVASTSALIAMYIEFAASASGSLGSIDFRCLSARG